MCKYDKYVYIFICLDEGSYQYNGWLWAMLVML